MEDSRDKGECMMDHTKFILLHQWDGDEGGYGILTWINPKMITQMTRRGEEGYTVVYLCSVEHYSRTRIQVEETPAEIMTLIINRAKGIDLDMGYFKQERQA